MDVASTGHTKDFFSSLDYTFQYKQTKLFPIPIVDGVVPSSQSVARESLLSVVALVVGRR